MNDLNFNIHDSISFENLTSKFWCKRVSKSGKYASIELSLKADGIQIFPLAKMRSKCQVQIKKVRERI